MSTSTVLDRLERREPSFFYGGFTVWSCGGGLGIREIYVEFHCYTKDQ